jgi:UDP-N-acetylmuramyl pentapeptide phosphotransferase/UDP-N-acetylglucosamine-1-phosphate transferase
MRWGRLAVENHRGVLVPRILGVFLAAVALAWTAAYDATREAGPPAWTLLLGSLLVFAAGIVDDIAPSGPRGLREHLRALARGTVTTGVLKAVVTVGASVVVTARLRPPTAWEALSGVVLLAACANVWNGLDVRPGRALKAYLPVGLAFVLAGDVSAAPVALGVFVGALVALPADLRELAMLGDAGSNLLGFVAGIGLVLVLPGWAVAGAAAVAVALNLVAEMVTFSRAIDRVPPLRWLDRLGRLPSAD